jgi:hypothetical protein
MQTKLQRGGGTGGFVLSKGLHPERGETERWALLSTVWLVLTLLCLGCSREASQEQLAGVLTTGAWVQEVGTGPLQESYVYAFWTNGTYRVCVYSDFGVRAVKGTWRLSPDNQVGLQLHLDNPEAYYFCLWRQSGISYDSKRDVLLFSGGFAGAQELRHLKLTNKESGLWYQRPKSERHGDELRDCPSRAAAHRH